MADKNYTFDPDSLTYKKDEKKRGKRILISFLTQLFAAIFIAIIVFLTISYAIKTPRQKRIAQENEFMQQEYKKIEEKYNQAAALLDELKKRDKELYRSVYETELVEDPDNDAKTNAINQNYPGAELLDAVHAFTDTVIAQLQQEEADFNELKYLLKNAKEALPNIPCIQPIEDLRIENVYYGFGHKLDPIYKTPQIHNGLDIAAKTATSIVATADGVVEYVGESREYGKHIIIDHKNGYKTLYAHLNDYSVKKNQNVTRSSVIGFVGNSGKSLTPHLHYGVSYNGKWLNPIYYFFGDIGVIQFKQLKKIAGNSGLSLD